MTDDLLRPREPVTLTKLPVAASTYVSRHAVVSLHHDDMEALVRDELMVRLESHVLAEHLVGDTYCTQAEFPFPASPWQFFKNNHRDSWWLGWLVARRPVRFTWHRQPVTVKFDRYATYPHAAIDSPPLGTPVLHEQATRLS